MVETTIMLEELKSACVYPANATCNTRDACNVIIEKCCFGVNFHNDAFSNLFELSFTNVNTISENILQNSIIHLKKNTFTLLPFDVHSLVSNKQIRVALTRDDSSLQLSKQNRISQFTDLHSDLAKVSFYSR